MSKELSLLDTASALPAYLQGIDSGVGKELMEAVGGQSLNRIGTKGSRFRQVVGGEEVGVFDENYLDVIIVGAAPAVSRKYYKGAYDPEGDNAAPVCYSVDGITPEQDVHQKQAEKCAICPQNVKGSKISDNGGKSKACGYFRRLVVMLANDESGFLYRLDVAAMGLFGESHVKQQKYALNDYAKALANRGLDAGTVVTRLSFDTDQSVPKLLFQPNRFISEEDASTITTLSETEKATYLEVSFKTIDLSEETVGAPALGSASKPATKKAATKKAAAPAPAPEPEEEEEVEPELTEEEKEEAELLAKMAALKARKAAAREDGEARVAAAAKPATQKPTAQKPSPAVAQKAKPATAAAPVAAAVTEVSSDDELNDLLGDLGL